MELFDFASKTSTRSENSTRRHPSLLLTGMGELMKHGCTTCFDHHYVLPTHAGDLIGAQFAAADTRASGHASVAWILVSVGRRRLYRRTARCRRWMRS